MVELISLFEAIENGDLTEVKNILSTAEGRSLLTTVNASNETALNHAAFTGQEKIVEAILATAEGKASLAIQDESEETPLNNAVDGQNKEMVEAILATPEGRATLATPDKDGWTPLNVAAGNESPEIVDAILATSEGRATLAMPNKQGWTPLNMAASQDNKEAVKAILKTDEGKAILNVSNDDKMTPIMNALHNQNPEVVEILSKSPGVKITDADIIAADKYVKDHPRTTAADAGKDEAFKLELVKMKAQIDARNAAPAAPLPPLVPNSPLQPNPPAPALSVGADWLPAGLSGQAQPDANFPGPLNNPVAALPETIRGQVADMAAPATPPTDAPAGPTDDQLFARMTKHANDGSIIAGRHIRQNKAKEYNNADEVKLIQATIGVKVDGQFGKETEEGLKEFQKSVGLTGDKKVSRLTVVALQASYNSFNAAYDKLPDGDKGDKTILDSLNKQALEDAKKAIAEDVHALVKDKAYSSKVAEKALAVPPSELQKAVDEAKAAHKPKQHTH